jgi:peptide-methionine (S)-S-oxide reductase
MQAALRRCPGVVSTRVGYTGGDVENATYRDHRTHAEATKVVFDTKLTSFRSLLDYFFQKHDPTTLNQQGDDIGPSYRSAIFYMNETQRQIAEEMIAALDASGLWPSRIVTEVAAAGPFWEAEAMHQDFLER